MATVVIGLGSNLQKPLLQLRQAICHLQAVSEIELLAVSRIYRSAPLLLPNTPREWLGKFYLNAAVRLTTKLSPQTLLERLKQIEKTMGRSNAEKWAPRCIDLDILVYDQVVLNTPALTLPHPELYRRSCAWIPLQEVDPEYQHPLYPKLELDSRDLEVLPHLLCGPQIVGIVNVTPDSFSDGNRFLDPGAAIMQAQRLFREGADIIDIGAESTRPTAQLVDQIVEWQRLEPVLRGLQQYWSHQEHRPLISIDTRHAQTIEQALPYGVDWINDVSQEEFAAMRAILHTLPRLKYVLMHHCGVPPQPNRLISGSPMNVIREFQEEWFRRFEKLGLTLDQLILDPGIGFGKTKLQQYEILRRMQELTEIGGTWLVGHSRKLSLTLGEHERTELTHEACTAMISAYLGQCGVQYLRVHNPAPNLAAIRLSTLLS